MIYKLHKIIFVYFFVLIILPTLVIFTAAPLLSKNFESIINDPYIEKESRNLILQSISCNVSYDNMLEIITQNKKAFVGKDQFGRTIIHDLLLLDITNNILNALIDLAVEMGVNINFKNYLWTGGSPIHDAVRLNDKDKLDILIMNGADIHMKNNMGETPLAYSLRLNHISIVNHIINKYEVDKKSNTVVISDFRRFIYAIIFTGYQRPWAFITFMFLLVIYFCITITFFRKGQFNFQKENISTETD